jgi:hypothetical protein
MGYQIGNIYGITAIAVIGGGLFGFDISSMSAMSVFLSTFQSTSANTGQSTNTTVPLLLQPGPQWPSIQRREMLGSQA